MPSARLPVRGWRLPAVTGRFTKLGLVTFGVTQLVLLFWWVAFFPGLMSYDSVTYIWQVTTSNWSTSHSIVYNGVLWLSLQLTGQVALLTFLQTVVMAGGLAYTVTGLRRLGVPGRWLGIAAVAAVCLPALGTFTVYVSKDVAFVLCELWLLGTVARILANRPAPPKRLLWTLFAELALISVFRPNGFVVIALTVAGVAVVLVGLRWRLAACGAAAIAFGFLATNVVFPAMGVQRAGSELVLGPAYADLAVAYRTRPSIFHDSDKVLLATVAPLSYWRSTANCYNADDTVAFNRPQFSIDAARAHQQELFDLWLRVVERAPDVVLQARICRGNIAWNPLPGPPQGWTVKIPIAGVGDYFDFPKAQIAQSPDIGAIRLAPLSRTANKLAVFARRVSDTPSFEWFAWRGATWAYLAYFAVGLFARRRRQWAPLALVAVIAATQITVAVNNPGQLVRYMAGPLLLGILLLPFAFARPGTREAPTVDGLAVDGPAVANAYPTQQRNLS